MFVNGEEEEQAEGGGVSESGAATVAGEEATGEGIAD